MEKKIVCFRKRVITILFIGCSLVFLYGCKANTTKGDTLSLKAIDSLLTLPCYYYTTNINKKEASADLFIFLDGNCSCSIEAIEYWDRVLCQTKPRNKTIRVNFILFGDPINANGILPEYAKTIQCKHIIYYYSVTENAISKDLEKLYAQQLVLVNNNEIVAQGDELKSGRKFNRILKKI